MVYFIYLFLLVEKTMVYLNSRINDSAQSSNEGYINYCPTKKKLEWYIFIGLISFTDNLGPDKTCMGAIEVSYGRVFWQNKMLW